MSIKKCKKDGQLFQQPSPKIFLHLIVPSALNTGRGARELDILALGSCALGQNGDAVYHGAACQLYQMLHGQQGAAGGDHIVHKHNALATDEGGVVAAQEQALGSNGGDGLILHMDGVGHIDLLAFASDEILLCAGLAGHFMDEGDALGFGSEEIVVAAGLQQLQHGFGTSHSQLSVTKADKGANVQIVRYLADRQLPLQTGYCQRIVCIK